MSAPDQHTAVTPDLPAAAAAVDKARAVVAAGVRHLAEAGGVEANQVVAYDLAHAAAAVEVARAALDYGARGAIEAAIACAFVADAVFDLVTKTMTREPEWGMEHGALREAGDFVRTYRDPAFYEWLFAQKKSAQ